MGFVFSEHFNLVLNINDAVIIKSTILELELGVARPRLTDT